MEQAREYTFQLQKPKALFRFDICPVQGSKTPGVEWALFEIHPARVQRAGFFIVLIHESIQSQAGGARKQNLFSARVTIFG